MNAFVFPGQGSQFIGMGKDFYNSFTVARDVFLEVDAALSQKLSQLMFDGSESELNLTVNAQPALMTVSMAILKVLQVEGGFNLPDKVKLVAGHSLGEYTAIAAAGGFALPDCARLLRIRGRAMQEAVPTGQGAMAAILGVNLSQAQQLADHAAQNQICAIANDNAPGQVVLSGHKQAIERAVAAARDFGASRAVLLIVSAPFHSSLMLPAATIMKQALDETLMRHLDIPLMANVNVDVTDDPEHIKLLLVEQVTGRVRWRESVAKFAQHDIKKVIEIGAGKVLTGLIKRIDATLEAISFNTPQDIKLVIEKLGHHD